VASDLAKEWIHAAVALSWASDVTPEEGFAFVAIHPGMVATDMSTTGWR